VSSVVGDLSCRQAYLVEPGRHGLAEDLRGDPVEAGPVESCAQVDAGVVQIAQNSSGLEETTSGVAGGRGAP
jgi:hypothetical protein